MAYYYRSKAGETLDWICWQYYIKEISLGAAAMAVDPRLLANSTLLENSSLLGPDAEENLRGIVEQVLQANPFLTDYPMVLPRGLTIVLPEPNNQQHENNSVKLWD